MSRLSLVVSLAVFPLIAGLASTVEALEKIPPIARRLPPPGIEVSPDKLAAVQKALDAFTNALKASQQDGNPPPADVAIYHKAIDLALRNGEFYSPRDLQRAGELIQQGMKRLEQVNAGQQPWKRRRGLVVRGYRSKLDNSAQPFGLEIPKDYDFSKPAPLYVWLHGRGDKTTDLSFIYQRQTSAGRIAPANAMVLHPFGRYCNAFKFAGEVDVFEAIDAVKRDYKIDPDRIVLWGFSMGGAGAWHLGAHYPDRWVAVSPGAGFAETRRYQNIQPKDYPPKYEQTLWNLFDVPSYVRNLFNVPVVAYSGEIDKQKQAALVMEEAFAENGQKLTHLIGPGMGHKYHPDTLKQITRMIGDITAKGEDRFPQTVTLQTRTLRYNRCQWVEILGLNEHWRDSRVDAKVTGPRSLNIATKNVSAFRLSSPWRNAPQFSGEYNVQIDGKPCVAATGGAASKTITFVNQGQGWQAVRQYPSSKQLRKLPGLQGPIDDVLMAPFLVVTPTGKAANPQIEQWVQFEMRHFLDRWRDLFRGEARVKRDTDVTDDDVRNYHLVLWGDRQSNKLIGKMADSLPIRQDAKTVTVGEQSYPADRHVGVLIYPNPLNSSRYVVLNSGLTFREGHDRTNSLQNPKLPDWAVIDVSVAPNALQPGKVVDAGFFDEQWRLK